MAGASVTVRSYRKEREAEIMGNLGKAMEDVGALVEAQAKINVSRTGGDHPQVQTGQLRAGIGHRVETESGKIMAVIGTNVEHGMFLEFGTSRMPPYPWLFPAVELQRENIKEAIKIGNAEISGGVQGEGGWVA